RNYELDLRNELSKQLERGKIDLSINVESKKAETPVEINIALAKSYYEQVQKLAVELKEPLSNPIFELLKFPDVLKAERKEGNEKEWEQIKSCIDKAIVQLNVFREKEGKSLELDFDLRLKK